MRLPVTQHNKTSRNRSICFLDKNRNINIWNPTSKEITSYGFFDMEILQMLNDGSVIGYKNKSFIRSLNG
jgi:hypothetical protein